MLTITTASILAALPAFAQTAPFCGTNAPAPPANPLLLPIPSPRAGLVLPSRGTINALVVFIDFADDTTDIANVNWPRGEDSTDMTGHGPNFMNLFIDRTPEQQSGRKGNVTTF